MHHRTLIGTIAMLGFIALAGLFSALSLSLSSPSPAYAQANSPPQFPPEEITLEMEENMPPFESIGDPVTASDDDSDRLTYSLEHARTLPFTIDTFTGQLQTGAPLDYETRNSYTVKVIATDPSKAKDTIIVTINVTNVDEDGKVSLTWTRPHVGTLIEASLADPDGSVSGVTWQWARADSSNVNYTDINGATSATYTTQSGDERKYLRATATYTDLLGPGKKVSSAAAYVKPDPNPNRPPDFQAHTGGGYDCSRQGWEGVSADTCLYISRSAPAGSEIYYPGHVTDPDRDEVRYSLGGTDDELFHIDPLRGDLYTTDAYDYEERGDDVKFEITITATDPSGLSDSITAALKPSGSSENPAVNGPSNITYPENGTWPLATYTATNQGGPTRGWIIGVEPGGGDGDFFDIDDDGVLTFTQPPDYEDPADENGDNKYSFTIMAYDSNPTSGQRPGQSFYNVSVTVVDVPGEVLEIHGPTALDYPENGADAVHTYTVSNADGPVSWSLSGDDAGKFSISNSGELTFNTPPDYENPTDADGENDYLLSITVIETGDGGDQAKIEPVRVEVTNVNEPPTFDEGETATRSVGENANSGDPIGDPVEATDPDGDGLTYTLGGTDASSFTIVDYSGQLQTSAPLDHETRTSYTVMVTVSDGKDAEGNADTTADDTITVTINVTGENEPPEFPGQTDTRTVAENTQPGKDIGAQVAATDPDDGDTLTYSLEGTDAASFHIVSDSGQIQTTTGVTYDYETTPRYTVTVKANDSNGGTDTIDVTITVTNVNEAGTVTLSPDQPSARAEITATLTDPDGGVTGTSWQWAKSSDGTTGWVNVGTNSPSYTPVDDDMGHYLRATASYTDDLGPNKSAQAVTAQAVQAGANRPPEFDAATATREIPENTEANTDIGGPVTATDPDDGDTLTYTLGNVGSESFSIDQSSGQLRTKAALDYETRASYNVTITATDPENASDTIDVTITVSNVEEPGTVTLSNNQPSARTEITATLTDPDDGVMGETWSWERSMDKNAWDPITGATSNAYTPADGDVGHYLRATASYTDGEGPNKSAQAVSDNAVQAGANRPPEFDATTATREVPENTGANTNIGSPVTANDPDTGNTLTYSLEGTDAASFQIVSASGQIQTETGVTYDHETTPSYSVTVKATDTSSATDTIDVTITVTNLDEDGAVTLTDERPVVDTALTATLDDPDRASGTTWQWARADSASGTFTDIGGATTSSYTPSTGDVGKYLQATASYTDGHGTGKSAQAVSANPVQAPPEFSSVTAIRSVDENAEMGANIGAPVTATDADTLTYTLGEPDEASFDIEPESGQLRTKEPLDYETKKSYEVTVTATDPSSLTASITVTITITNVEEAGTVTLSPNQPTARSAITATLADPDGGVTGTSWQWAKSSDGSTGWTNFGADSSSYTPPDTDMNYYLRATASYTDGHGPNKRAEAKTTQAVGAGTNRKPELGPTSTTRDVAENTAADQPVGAAVTANDLDSDTLTYSLSGADADLFTIDTGTGQIKVKTGTALDYEGTRNSYTVVVEVTDSKNADGDTDTTTTIDDSIIVTINVTNVEEGGTVTLSMTHPSARAEITATLTDPDGSVTNESWQWAKSSTAQGTYTNISDATSATYTPDDADVGEFLKATATYEDSRGSGKTAERVSDNAVGSGANRAPEFPDTTATREFPENTGPGMDIDIPVKATDADNDVLEYTLEGTDKDSFQIVSTSGQIQTKSGETYDHETKDSYSVTVKADDREGSTDTIAVTITVTDVDEPTELTGPASIDYAENRADAVATYTATDPENGAITWSVAGDDSGDFSISEAGELTFNTPPDFESPADDDTNNEYLVTVQASDGTTTDTIDVTITVTNVNEKPQFPNTETASLEVPENTPTDTNIGGPVAANDPDAGDALTYSLEGQHATSFSIDPSSGQLKTNATLDFETQPQGGYWFNVLVRDSKDADGSPDIESDATIPVTITVTDTNEPPAFPSTETGARTIAENTAKDQPIGDPVEADDPENDTLIYALGGTNAASFDIDTDTGQLKTEAALDKESKASYTFTVSVHDGKNAAGGADTTTDDTIEVNITVTDANDPPTFSDGTVSFDLPENSAPGTNVGTPVTATDTDTSDELTYTLEGTDEASFDIDDTTGQIKTKQGVTYNYESKPSYSVTVKADDGNGGTATKQVTITVTDVDEPPVVTGSDSVNYAENRVDAVYTYTATDPESGTITWSLSGTDSGAFSITGGVLTFDTPPDFEAPSDQVENNVYLLIVEASGGPNSDTLNVTITVTDVNELPAFPSTETGTRSVLENSPPDTNIGPPVAATDPDDGDTLTYTLGGTDAALFNIVTSSGQLQTKGALDYETKPSYSVIVSVRDGRDANGNTDTTTDATTPVTIVITDLNEQPTFALEMDVRTIDENTAPETNIGTPIAATDPDNDYTLSYSLREADAESFRINASTGQLQTKGELDFEATPSYTVTVSVHDGKADDGSPNQATDDTINVTITVTDVEEPGTVTLSSVQPQVGIELTANLDDPDGSITGITWLWESSLNKSSWTPISGVTSATYTPVAGDLNKYLRVTATYTDRRGVGKTAQAVSTNEVQAAPITNDQPAFSAETADRTIPENTAANTDIGDPVTATDLDNDALTYTLSGTDSASFDIVQGSGQLKTKVALDHETKDSYTVTVTATDPSGESDEITVTITVIDVNEAPEVTVTPTVYFAENDSGPIATYTATDPDDNPVTWSLLGADAEDFSISEGVLTFKSPPNYEDPADADTDNVYPVTVKASDGTNTVTLGVTVTVTNVDEAGTVTISPEQPRVGTALTATLTDPDGDVSGTTWQWARSSDGSNNWVDIGTDSPSYTPAVGDVGNYLRATASYADGQGSGKTAQAVSANAVEAAPVTNMAPDFPPQPATRTVPENTGAGQSIGEPVAANDQNAGDTLTYTLGGTDAASFNIVASSGQLQTKAALNFESKNSYTVTVTAADPSNTWDIITVTITVTDVNEAPVFAAETDTRTIAENTSAGQDIGAPVAATDPDTGATLTYILGGTNAGDFNIDASSGQLQTKAALDYETKSSYSVEVSVRDSKAADGTGDSAADDTITVTVTITNADEAETVTLSSVQPQVGSALTATLEDPDGGVSGETWVWARFVDPNSSWTDITGATSDSYTPVDDDLGKYLRVTVSYTDGHGSGKSAREVSDNPVRAAPVNNVAPAFSDTSTTRSVAENTVPGTDIGDPVAATDSNSDPLTYTLSGTDSASFDIVQGSGQLQTKAALDHETKNSYEVTVSVRDSKDAGGSADTATDNAIAVTITVTNVDEAGTVTLSPAQPQAGTALTATLDDPDGSISGETWKWERSPDKNSWTLISSVVSDTYTPAVGDVGNYLRATASYADGQGSGKTAQAVSANAVEAAPVTNMAPDFPPQPATRTVPENTGAGQSIGEPVAANDQNAGDTLTYTLGGTDAASFNIVASSGQLQTKAALNFESKNSYTVTVTAADPSNTWDIITVTITVTDVNEAPVFAAETDTRTIAENTSAGQDIGAPVAATDPDTGATLTYILGGTNAGDFNIDASSGQLQTKAALDYETKSSYSVEVSVRDSKAADGTGDSAADDTITVTVTITNADEAETVTLSSVQPQVGSALTATLEDPDGGVSGETWVWARFVDPNSSWTDITGATSDSYTPVDDDLGKYLRVTVSYTDGHGSGKSAREVSDNPVRAAPVNNVAPAFSDTSTTRSVAENTVPGTDIGDPVAATDSNSDPLTYTLSGTDSASFDIVQGSGQLKTKVALDRETKQTYTVTVTAADPSNLSDTITVTITVSNVNEAPVIGFAASIDYAENRRDRIATYTATDPEQDTITWSLSGDDSGDFFISGTGELTFNTPPDHEAPADADTNNRYEITVQAFDGTNTSYLPLTITVTDVNEAPAFPVGPHTRTIAENTEAGENIGAPVAAVDPDADDTLIYTLGGTDAASFDIIASSGQLQTKGALDYETKSSYSVEVSVRDSKAADGTGDSAADDTITVTVTITNADEAGTVILSSIQPQVDTPLTATLGDPDDVRSVTWRWERPSNKGSWDPITSATSASYTPVAADVGDHLRATASYTDGHGPGKSAQAVSDNAVSDNEVRAAPVTNGPPTFSAETAGRTIAENTAPDTNIGNPVTATDPDTGDRDKLTYKLGGTDAKSFSIVAATGQLQTKAALDHETKNSYEVTVSVRDSKDAGGSADTATDNAIAVTITVTNVDEAGTVTLSPAQPQAGTALTATLDDPDGSISGETWKWERSPDKNSWTLISSVVSDTYTPAVGDVGNYLRATASYADGQGSGKTAQAVSANAVEAAPVTNMAPDFPPQPATRTVPENTGAGQSIGEPVAANDQNAGDTLTYTLGGTDAASFNIVASSGQLQTKAALNFESKNSYTVTVTAADPSNTWDIITVTITVTDVNEAPVFAAETDTRTIAENTSAGQDIGAPVAATDPDTGATLTYILGGTNAGDFNIDASSGQLQTKAALDYETKSSYSVEVSVRDSKAADGTGDSAADDTITVTVTITNADEAETVTLSSVQPQVGSALTATLEDPDGGVSGETWVWARFVDPNSSWTDITGATSDSYTPVDDDLGKYLRVTVSYTDGHGSGKSAREVSDNPVRAAPVNNAAPAFSDTSTTRSVAENTVPGTDIGDPVAAVDPDAGDTLIYTLGGTDAASFDIIASSGQLQTKGALDYETKPSYSVEVSVRDSKAADGTGDSAADDTITVTVTITNADEAGTVILSSVQPQVDTPLTATLEDPDDVRSVTWRWERPSNKGSWDPITSATSASYTPVAADVGDHLRATASYTDGHGPGKSAQAVSDNEVRAAPVTNNPPTFSAETAGRTIAENTAPDTNIGNPVTATDPDTGDRDKLTYKLGGTDAVSFDIIASSGQLQTKAALDHETKQTYTVTVTAADPSGESDTITVTITVSNVNEAPVIGFAASIDYAENRSDRIATYTATDPEQDAITWSLSGADSEDFFISGTGELTFKTPPDHEAPADADTNNRYEITVQASDGTKTGDLPLTITVTNVDEAPELTGEVSIEYAENGTGPVATYTANDPEKGEITWSLSGDDRGDLEISESGELAFKPSPNFEAPADADTNNVYEVTVKASDGTHTVTMDVTITVTDANDPPVLPDQGPGTTGDQNTQATREVAENTVAGVGIGAPVAATDLDTGNTLTYTLAGTDAASFAIVETSGQLQTKAPLDYETKSSYTVTVIATDPSSGADTITVTITVTDENEPPEVTGDATVDYTENGDGPVVTYTATDPENGAITWSVGGDDSGDFSIGEAGELTFNTPPDFESPADDDTNNDYLVTVQASDGTNTGTLDVTIAVVDKNEPPPAPAAPTVEAASTSGHNRLSVSWQAPDATGIPAITGYDAEYRKKDTTEDWGSAKVTVSGTGATITGVTPNTLYEVQVRAKNDEGEGEWSPPGTGRTGRAPTRGNSGRGSSSSSSGSGSYSLPVNNPPVFTEGASATRSVAENTAADWNIGDPVTATDPDKDPLAYALGGADSASFTVDDDSGQLKTRAALDFESKSTYTVTVTADDGKKGVAAIDVTVAVTDVVEAPIDNPETVSQPFTQVPAPLPAPLPVAVAPVVIVNEKGDLGSQGRQGRQGQQGEAGPAGVAGQQGRQGQQGQGGETGPPGVAGPQGPQGPRGSAGPPGYNGSSGVDGPRGLTGEQGPPGGDASTRTKYIALIVAVVTLPLVLLLWVWNWLRTPNRPRNRRLTGRRPRPTQTGRPAHPHGEGPE